ncbi:MAG: CBS domain-containing protein [Nitrospirota bacterium]|nr:CBS domain-containing protein [Nitrospirota bacterium]
MSESQPSADRPAGAVPEEQREKETGTAPPGGLPAVVYTVPPETTVFEVAQVMASEGAGDVLVAWDQKPVGILTDRDLVVRVLAREANPKTLLVWEVMSKPLVLASDTQDIGTAVDLMVRHGIRRLPIVDDAGQLESILTLDDMLLLGLNGRPHLRAIIQGQLESKKAGMKPAAAEEPGLSFREIAPITQAFSAAVAVARNRAQDVCSVISEAPIREAAQAMVARDVGDVFVVVDRKPVGILTDRDLVVRVMATGADPDTTLAWEAMTQPLVTVTDDAGVEGAVALMARHGIRRLPIVDDAGQLISVLTLDDILLLGLNGNLELSEILKRQLRPRALPPRPDLPAPPVTTVEPPLPQPPPVIPALSVEMRAAPPRPQPPEPPTRVAPPSPQPEAPPPAATVEPPRPQPPPIIPARLSEICEASPVATAPRSQSPAQPARAMPASPQPGTLSPVEEPSPQPKPAPPAEAMAVEPATLPREARAVAESPPILSGPGENGFGDGRFSQPVSTVARKTVVKPLRHAPKTKVDYARAWLFWNRSWLQTTAWLVVAGVVLAALAYLAVESGWLSIQRNMYEPKDEERRQYLERLQKEREQESQTR